MIAAKEMSLENISVRKYRAEHDEAFVEEARPFILQKMIVVHKDLLSH